MFGAPRCLLPEHQVIRAALLPRCGEAGACSLVHEQQNIPKSTIAELAHDDFLVESSN
jgi:hypothetical protein